MYNNCNGEENVVFFLVNNFFIFVHKSIINTFIVCIICNGEGNVVFFLVKLFFIFFHKSVINMSYMFIQNVRTGKNVNNNMIIMMIVIKIIVEFLKKCQTK